MIHVFHVIVVLNSQRLINFNASVPIEDGEGQAGSSALVLDRSLRSNESANTNTIYEDNLDQVGSALLPEMRDDETVSPKS